MSEDSGSVAVGPGAGGPRPLSSRVAAGVGWLFGRTLVSKVLAFAGQLVLARLLTDTDFGVYALCVLAVSLGDLVGQAGVKQVVVQRGRFALWAGPAFWMNALGGVGAAGLVLGMGPVLSAAYGTDLHVLMMVLAVDAFLRPLALVPRAKLEIDMRFGMIAAIGVMEAVLTTALMVGFAAMGLGAMSLALARPLTALAALVVLFGATGAPPSLRPRASKWKFLLASTAFVMGSSLLYKVTQQGDKAVLGFFVPKEELGQYNFAFGLSMQTLFLVASNLHSVMMPALSSISSNAEHQRKTALRGSRVAAVVTTPVCVGLSIAAADLVPMLYGVRWSEAGGVLSLFAAAMVFRTVTPLVVVLIEAQGRFGASMRGYLLSVAMYVPLVAAGSWAGGVAGCAASLVVHGVLAQVVFLKIACPAENPARLMMSLYGAPLAASVVPAVLAAGGVALSSAWGVEGVVERGLIGVSAAGVYGVLYAVLLFAFFPGVIADAPPGVRRRMPVRLSALLDRRAASIAARRGGAGAGA